MERMQRKRNTPPLLAVVQAGTTILEINLVISQKTRHDTTRVSLYILLLGIYPEVFPAYYKYTCSTMFIAALFIIASSWKEARCTSMEEWIEKMWYIYTMKYYSAIKSNEFTKFLGKWVELENVILSEATQPQKKTRGTQSLFSRY